jgi:hypothetical protein
MTYARFQQPAMQDSPTETRRTSNESLTKTQGRLDESPTETWRMSDENPTENVAMMLQNDPELRNEGSVVRRAWDVQETTRRTSRCSLVLHRYKSCCCVVANRVVASLQIVLLRHYSSRCYGVTALQATTLRRCNLRGYLVTTLRVATTLHYDAATLRVAAILWCYSSRGCSATRGWQCGGVVARVAATLQHYSSRCYGTAHGYNAAALQLALLWRCAWLQCCDAVARVFFFFWNDSWQVQESSTSSCTCKKDRNREQERTRDSFGTCFGLTLPSSSALVWS